MGLLKKIFGTYSERELKQIYPVVDKIEAMADAYKALSDAQLQAKTGEFKERLKTAKRWMIFCPRLLPRCGRRLTGCWAFGPIGCSWWAALCSTRGASPR